MSRWGKIKGLVTQLPNGESSQVPNMILSLLLLLFTGLFVKSGLILQNEHILPSVF